MLNLNKIKETIISKDFKFEAFIKRVTGMSPQGFNYSVNNRTLKISVLEKISEELGVNPGCWWDYNVTGNIMNESEVNKLRKQHEKDQVTIENLNDHIADLKEKLNQTGHKERKAG